MGGLVPYNGENRDGALLPYYGEDRVKAKMFAPIDEYLKLSARLDPKGRGNARRIKSVAAALALIAAAVITAVCFAKGNVLFGTAAAFATGALLAVMILMIKGSKVKITADHINAGYVLETDGLQSVYDDYISAAEFTKKSVIGKRYIFVKGKTVIRLTDIYDIRLVTEHDDDPAKDRTFLRLAVTNASGEYVYELDMKTLPRNEQKRRYKEAELIDLITQKRDRIDTAHDRNRRANARKYISGNGKRRDKNEN